MGGQSNFCQIIKSESMDFDLLKDKGTCKPAQNTLECVFLFGTETCDTSKLCKWWMVGRWMEPTALLFFAQTVFLLFQIIFK